MWALAPKTSEGIFLLITTGEGIQIKMIILQPRKLKKPSHWRSHSSVSKTLGDLGELSYFERRHCICSLQAPRPEQHQWGGTGRIQPF